MAAEANGSEQDIPAESMLCSDRANFFAIVVALQG